MACRSFSLLVTHTLLCASSCRVVPPSFAQPTVSPMQHISIWVAVGGQDVWKCFARHQTLHPTPDARDACSPSRLRFRPPTSSVARALRGSRMSSTARRGCLFLPRAIAWFSLWPRFSSTCCFVSMHARPRPIRTSKSMGFTISQARARLMRQFCGIPPLLCAPNMKRPIGISARIVLRVTRATSEAPMVFHRCRSWASACHGSSNALCCVMCDRHVGAIPNGFT